MSNGKSGLLINIDINGNVSDGLATPEEFNFIGSLACSYSFKNDNFLSFAWIRSQGHVVVKTGLDNVVIKWIVPELGLFPFLPCALVLSASHENQISSLNKDSFSLKSCNLTTVVQVNQDNFRSVEGDSVL